MKTTKINWDAQAGDFVVRLKDFDLVFTSGLEFSSPNMPFRGMPGYQLIYKPTGHIMAEGVDPVAAVAQTFREQRILDRVKANPKLLTEDPAQGQLADFLQNVDVEGQQAN